MSLTKPRPIPWPPSDKLLIGYGRGCDFSLDESRPEELIVEISKMPGGWAIRDLGGSTPALLDGRPICGRSAFPPGSTLLLGTWRWTMPAPENSPGVTITLQEVEFHVPSGGTKVGLIPRARAKSILLKGVNLQIHPGEFIGILGPSGAGKSTLLHLLNGDYTASAGRVWFDDQPAEAYLEKHKHRLAYLPQEPIFHDCLTPRQALDFTARLRGLTQPGQSEDSMTMLERVGILHRANTPLKMLSGGEKKRAALAIELLGNPAAVFLDEATSGLDPAREKEMMRLFRQLADTGKTVVCITHFPENLTLCDRLIVVAKGGVAFLGTPDELRQTFAITKIEEVYARLATDAPFQPAAPRKPAAPPRPAVQPDSDRSVPGVLQQLMILGQRYVRILLADMKNLLFMLFQAPVIAALIGVTFGVITDPPKEKEAADWKQVGFLLVMSVVWCAGTNGVREFVKERAIFQHESRYGLNHLAYLLSKFVPLSLMAIAQALLLLLFLAKITDLRGARPWQFVALAFLALACTGLGLCLSAISKTSERAMTLLPVILIAEAVFSGGLARLDGITLGTAKIGASAYWGLDGLKSTLDGGFVVATYPPAIGVGQTPILGPGGPLVIDVVALTAQTVVLLTICHYFLKRCGKRA